VAFLDNSGLAYFWNKIKSEISSESCIVCSPNQPENLKKGLWIKTDKINKAINILYDITEENCKKKANFAVSVDQWEGASILSVGNKCYLFGGGYNGTWTSCIQIYDLETNIITQSETTMTNGVRSGFSGVASVENMCYTFGGGQTGSNNSNTTKICNKYDTTTDICTQICSLCNPMVFSSATAVGEKCYIFGGYYYNGSTYSNYSYIQCYDSVSNIITTISNLRNGICKTSAVSIGTKCYIFGGRYEYPNGTVAKNYNYIQIYDTETNVLTSAKASLISATYGTSAAVSGGKCYIFGGSNTLAKIQIYDPVTDVCTTSDMTLPESFDKTSATSIDETFYVSKNNGVWWIGTFSKSDEYFLLDSILIDAKDSNSDSSNQIAVSLFGNIYLYKTINNIYYVDQKNSFVTLPFYRIENYQIV